MRFSVSMTSARSLQEQALRHLDLEAIGGSPVSCSTLAIVLSMSWNGIARREKFTATVPESSQRRGVLAGLAQHPVAERPDQAGLLGDSKEIARRQDAFARTLPAHQRLVAAQAAGGELELRLVEDDELVALQRQPQIALQRGAALHPLLHLGVEEGERVAALAPSPWKGRLSAARKRIWPLSALTG